MNRSRLWMPLALAAAVSSACTYQIEPLQEPLEPRPKREDRPSYSEPASPPATETRPGRRPPSGPGTQQATQSPAVKHLIAEARKHLESGDLSLAQSNLERAFRLANRDPWVSFYMSQLLLAQNEAVQAEQWAFQALSYFDVHEQQGKGQTWELIASCRRQQGDLRGANQAQKQADSFYGRLDR